jgi:hypothetical protein
LEIPKTLPRPRRGQSHWAADPSNNLLLRLPLLAPDIVTAIVNGKNPPQLTAKKLMRLALEISIDWNEQRERLGFQQR